MTIDTKDLLNSILSSISRIEYVKPNDIPNIEEPKQPENNNPTENQPEKENSENIDIQEEEKNPENSNQE